MNAVLMASFVVLVCGASIRRGRTDENPLCSVMDDNYPVTLKTLDTYLGNVNKRLNDLKESTTMRVQQMKIDSSVDGSDDEKSFMHLQIMNTVTDRIQFLDNFCYKTTSFQSMMRTHYSMLNQLANLLEGLSYKAADDRSRYSLETINTCVREVMTTIQIALQSKGQHVNPSKYKNIHRRHGTMTIHDRQRYEYVAMLDSLRISTYLYDLYN